MLGIVVLQQAPQLRRVLLVVQRSRLNEMSAENSLQQLAVHVLIEDVAIAQAMTTEASPHVELDRVCLFTNARYASS